MKGQENILNNLEQKELLFTVSEELERIFFAGTKEQVAEILARLALISQPKERFEQRFSSLYSTELHRLNEHFAEKKTRQLQWTDAPFRVFIDTKENIKNAPAGFMNSLKGNDKYELVAYLMNYSLKDDAKTEKSAFEQLKECFQKII